MFILALITNKIPAMKSVLTLLLCLVAHVCFSQTGKALFDEGEKLYNEKKYDEALAKLAEAERSNYKEANLYKIRGNCYYNAGKK